MKASQGDDPKVAVVLSAGMIQEIPPCLQRSALLSDFQQKLPRDHRGRGPYKQLGDSRVAPLETQLHRSLSVLEFSSRASFSGKGDEMHHPWDQGELDKVLDDLERLHKQGTGPSVGIYRSVLKACTRRKDLSHAKRAYAHLAKHGLECSRVLGEYVVSMLVNCGSLDDAVQVFQNLRHRTSYSWTAVISGYTRNGQARDSLRMYQCMREEGFAPNRYTLISLIKACSSLSDLKEGKRMHAEALRYRWDSDLFVGTSLVDMYAKCGSVVDAQTVFDCLSRHDVVSWNAMILAYASQGQAEKALQMYGRMADEDVNPNDRTFVNALQACSRLAEEEQDVFINGQSRKVYCLQRITALHADARQKGFELDAFVGSSLVSLYSRCGSILDAQDVFGRLSLRDVVSWTAMLSAYVKQGQAEKALHLYRQMLKDGVSPNDRTFVSALQACSLLAEKGDVQKLKYLEEGKAIHYDAWRKGYKSDLFIGSTLVSMYGKFGSVEDAQNVFDELPRRDVVSWNAMLMAYTQQGEAEKALMLYEEMMEDDVSPNDRTFVSALQACSLLEEAEQDDVAHGVLRRTNALAKGKAIHAEAFRKGYISDLFVVNTLISMYGKCGSIEDAQTVFDGLSNPDVVSWNSILAAYSQQADTEKIWRLYGQMMEEGASPDVRSFMSVLHVCVVPSEDEDDSIVNEQGKKIVLLEKAKAIHAETWRRGYHSDIFIGNTLISIYGKCGSVVDAQKVFDGLLEQDVVSWNALLAAYILLCQPEKVFALFGQMQDAGVSPDARTFVSILQAWSIFAEKEVDDKQGGKFYSLGKAKSIHAEVVTRGYQSDDFVNSALVTVYGKCGSLVDAQCMFDGLSQRDVVSWTAMLAAYVELGQEKKALQLYREMQNEGVTPSDITLVCILRACSSAGSLKLCRQIHDSLLSTNYILSPLLANTLIHAYGRCGSMVDAQSVFDAMPQPNVVSWSALIAGYAREGNSQASLQCYEEMQLACMRPNAVTFLSLLSACSHAGLVDNGVQYFESMSRDHGITPGIEHYGSLVDLLGRAGYFTILQNLMLTMPVPPDLSMYLCLLGACRKHGKVTLARQTFDAAIALQPKDAAAYVVMSNIYAQAGLWDHANDVTEMRQRAGAWKELGQSWIGHEQEMNTFAAEDSEHSQKEPVYRLLNRVSLELDCRKTKGYSTM